MDSGPQGIIDLILMQFNWSLENVQKTFFTKFYRGKLQHVSGITHHGGIPEADEELSFLLENLITWTWLHRIHKDLPSLVKQKYGPDLRAKTLATTKPEISQATDSLMDEIRANNDTKVLRTALAQRSLKHSTHKL